MSGTAETVNQGNETVNQEATNQAEPRMFTQDEVNEMIKNRIQRERAKHGDMSDYEELKEKAGKYDQLQEANKSELEKATGEAEKYKKMYNDLANANKVRDIRAAVAKETGVPEDLLTADTEEGCKEQASKLLAYKGVQSPAYPNLRDGGESKGAGNSSPKAQFSQWLEKNY